MEKNIKLDEEYIDVSVMYWESLRFSACEIKKTFWTILGFLVYGK